MIKAASFSRSRKISMLWPAPLKGFLGVDWETPETIGAAGYRRMSTPMAAAWAEVCYCAATSSSHGRRK